MAKPLPVAVESDSSEKWEAQMRKGCLEMAVLACLWHGKLYGLEILRALERDSQLILSEGTIYPILNRLRAEGLLQSQWVEAEAGHPRKYYELTSAGRERATRMAEMWTEFSAGLGSLIEPVLKSARKTSRDNGRSRKEFLL
jgi:PadR family transcriptional regulator, regulatory protein PadR